MARWEQLEILAISSGLFRRLWDQMGKELIGKTFDVFRRVFSGGGKWLRPGTIRTPRKWSRSTFCVGSFVGARYAVMAIYRVANSVQSQEWAFQAPASRAAGTAGRQAEHHQNRKALAPSDQCRGRSGRARNCAGLANFRNAIRSRLHKRTVFGDWIA